MTQEPAHRSAPEPWVRVLGVRHHGPGSARSVAAALRALAPDAVLVEGPADADPVLAFAGRAQMQPPVALLAYFPDDPGSAAFWPFAEFSPEWQAVRYALEHDVALHFCDLPAAASLGARATPDDAGDQGEHDVTLQARTDPIALLAGAAGHDDPERWWDDVVESRAVVGADPDQDGGRTAGDRALDAFAAVAEAMTALRDAVPTPVGPAREEEQRREAHMRQVLRRVLKAGRRRVVVVCGAWHVPALTAPLPAATADARLLRGLPRRAAVLTWVPWTHSRLAYASGYGAGVQSPGWYHHLFTAPDRTVVRWLTRVAGVLRDQDLPVSSAHVIEAVRLAETLATLRGRPLAGLAEVTEATRAVLCEGDEVALASVTGALVVGERLGEVPDDTPVVPLAADLRARARRLRLAFDPAERVLDLDLRKDTDRERSVLLHRLTLLEVPWGRPAASGTRATGTFRETWALRWEPSLEIAVVEASMWGSTVGSAAAARVVAVAQGRRTGRGAPAVPPSLPGLAALVRSCLVADLPAATERLLHVLADRAARDTDVADLMAAFPGLVEAQRYGDVRGTDTAAVGRVADTLLVRICAGLPTAVSSLDDDGAAVVRARVEAVHTAVELRAEQDDAARWLDTLQTVADRADVHGAVAGRAVRLLRDAGRLTPGDAADRLGRALSVGADAPVRAAWVDGFLAGGGLLLVHDRELLALLDTWVRGLAAQQFVDVLPLVRRTFGGFEAGERRAVADRVREVAAGSAQRAGASAGWPAVDASRGLPAVAAVATILGTARTARTAPAAPAAREEAS